MFGSLVDLSQSIGVFLICRSFIKTKQEALAVAHSRGLRVRSFDLALQHLCGRVSTHAMP